MDANRLPLISIIIPAYNAGSTISGTIESIEAQTYSNFEIIIVDDGSTDDTVLKISNLKNKFSNIRLINNEGPKSVCGGRNRGLEAAGGEFIMFVDADDRILPDMLEVLYNELISNNCDISGCSFFTWTNKDDDIWYTRAVNSISPESAIYSSKDYLNAQMIKCNNTRCWAKLYRKSSVGTTRFDEETVIGEDALFIVKLLQSDLKLVETSYQGYGYFQNPNGAMNRPFIPKYMDQITCWEKFRYEAAKIDASTIDEVTVKLLMGIMLVVGKLAELNSKKRRANAQYIGICHDKLVVEMRNSKAMSLLSKDYRIKCKFFGTLPKFYLWTYHFHKFI